MLIKTFITCLNRIAHLFVLSNLSNRLGGVNTYNGIHITFGQSINIVHLTIVLQNLANIEKWDTQSRYSEFV